MRKGRKLLVASIGVAAISYACNKEAREPVGNLRPVDPPQPDAATMEPVGNLRAPEPPDASPGPPPPPDAGGASQGATDAGAAQTGRDAGISPHPHPPVGNLRPPVPRDAGKP